MRLSTKSSKSENSVDIYYLCPVLNNAHLPAATLYNADIVVDISIPCYIPASVFSDSERSLD